MIFFLISEGSFISKRENTSIKNANSIKLAWVEQKSYKMFLYNQKNNNIHLCSEFFFHRQFERKQYFLTRSIYFR